MKKLNTIAYVAAAVLLLASCASKNVMQRDIKRMDIHFKPLSRADVTLVGNLQTETTITGVLTRQGKALDGQYAQNYKKGLISKSEATEIMYFAPNANEVITGSLYENDIFNSVYGSINLTNGIGKRGLGFLQKLKGAKLAMVSDPGMEFAYYALVEKYPDVDYFINVRFSRKTEVKGKKYTETVTVQADGVKLKTDN
ncbi:MAG: hypothetical protein KF900_05220 [Bacteroidetes bacterium]|nr:hypothetical protein [Bacteroidota bacterium]